MRRSGGRYRVMILGALALMSIAMPAFADTAVPATVSACNSYPGLTARIAGCIRDSIDAGAGVFFDEIYPYLQNAITIAMTLAVTLYGVLLSFGAVEKVGRDTFILLMKLAAVITFCNSSPWMVEQISGMMDGAAYAVVSYTPTSGPADSISTDFSQSKCLTTLSNAAADADVQIVAPWLGIDCIIDTVIGIHIIPGEVPLHDGTWYNDNLEADGNKGLSRSLLYLFFGAMESSVLGLVMAIIGFFFIYGMIMLIIRCLFIYIAGYMGITFLVIISPLIIPMILFKETKQYFDKWAKMLVSFALQPVIMLVFLIFSLTALDLCVYSSNYSIYHAIAGKAAQQSGFDLNRYLTAPRDHTTFVAEDPTSYSPLTYAACADCVYIIAPKTQTLAYVKADNPNPTPRTNRDTGGVLNNLLYAKCTPEDIAADATLAQKCAFTYPVTMIKHTINWAVMEQAYNATAAANGETPFPAPTAPDVLGQQIARSVMAAIFFCLMTVFILNGVLAVVPMIVGDLLGDLNQSPVLGGIGAGGIGGGKVGEAIRGLSKNIGANPMASMGKMMSGKK